MVLLSVLCFTANTFAQDYEVSTEELSQAATVLGYRTVHTFVNERNRDRNNMTLGEIGVLKEFLLGAIVHDVIANDRMDTVKLLIGVIGLDDLDYARCIDEQAYVYLRESIRPYYSVSDRACGTPLIMAVHYDRVDIFWYLVRQEADINVADSYYGVSPLIAASLTNNVRMTDILVRMGANLAYRSDDHGTALGVAESIRGENSYIATLIRRATEAECHDTFNTALDAAVEIGEVEDSYSADLMRRAIEAECHDTYR